MRMPPTIERTAGEKSSSKTGGGSRGAFSSGTRPRDKWGFAGGKAERQGKESSKTSAWGTKQRKKKGNWPDGDATRKSKISENFKKKGTERNAKKNF